jgi:hypothetical protein
VHQTMAEVRVEVGSALSARRRKLASVAIVSAPRFWMLAECRERIGRLGGAEADFQRGVKSQPPDQDCPQV